MQACAPLPHSQATTHGLSGFTARGRVPAKHATQCEAHLRAQSARTRRSDVHPFREGHCILARGASWNSVTQAGRRTGFSPVSLLSKKGRSQEGNEGKREKGLVQDSVCCPFFRLPRTANGKTGRAMPDCVSRQAHLLRHRRASGPQVQPLAPVCYLSSSTRRFNCWLVSTAQSSKVMRQPAVARKGHVSTVFPGATWSSETTS